jgi:hypothetical protein
VAKHPLYLTIHGHFYQPPRENPWTGEIEVQPSAAPDHDWNDRIARQCYTPNSASRLLDSFGKIKDIVNNYEYMSFNIGPTLMSWIRTHTPETYKRIQDADKKSAQRLSGHGNAVAQVYNHIIMPLASRKDRLTQIRWGIKDFEQHFSRKPEAMWLAETAINMDTVVDLIQEGIQYVILSPTQADSFRLFDEEDWEDCSDTSINTTRPYRIFPVDEKGKKLCDGYLDAFFYDAGLSSAVGFEHLLRDANVFAARIEGAFNKDNKKAQLISIGTDGESYGHHEPFGDMCAAYLYKDLCPAKDMIPVNYGWFLEKFPPVAEVRLKNAHSEGCAWSCAHGVGRWYRDCGCSTGAPHGWNQKWRGPLRKAFDTVAAEADKIFQKEFLEMGIEDPWKVRDEFGVVVSNTENNELRRDFIKKYLGDASFAEQKKFLALLEAQKFALFSYTSCGWFFNDILGLEPVQNMRYALRALELISPWCKDSESLREKVLAELAKAKSNQDGRDGAEIFETDTQDDVSSVKKVACGYAVEAFLGIEHPGSQFPVYNGSIQVLEKQAKAQLFSVQLTHQETLEEASFVVCCLKNNGSVKLFIKEGDEVPNAELTEKALKIWAETDSDAMFISCLDGLVPDVFKAVASYASQRAISAVEQEMQSFAERHHLCNEFLEAGVSSLGSTLYALLGANQQFALRASIQSVLEEPTTQNIIHCRSLLRKLHSLDLDCPVQEFAAQFEEKIKRGIESALEKATPSGIRELSNLITLADALELQIGRSELENLLFESYQSFLKSPKNRELVPLLEWMNFSIPQQENLSK